MGSAYYKVGSEPSVHAATANEYEYGEHSASAKKPPQESTVYLIGLIGGFFLALFGTVLAIGWTVPNLRVAYNYKETPASMSLGELAQKGPKDNNHVRLSNFGVRLAGMGCQTYGNEYVSSFIPLVPPGREETAGTKEIQAVLVVKPAWSEERYDKFLEDEDTVDGIILGRGAFPTYAAYKSVCDINPGTPSDCWVVELNEKPNLQAATYGAGANLAMGALGMTLLLFCHPGGGSISRSPHFMHIAYLASGIGYAIRKLKQWMTPTGLAAAALLGGTALTWAGAELFQRELNDLVSNGDGLVYATLMLIAGVTSLLFGVGQSLIEFCTSEPTIA